MPLPGQTLPLSTNTVAAQQMLNKLVEQAERGKSGLVDPFQEHLASSLTEHLKGFRDFLEAKANTPEHVTLTLSRIRAVMVGCGFKRLADLNADKVGNWLKTRREESEGRFGVATSNHHLVAVKSFGNWLVKAQRLPRNPFVHLSRLNAKVDVRVERRALDAMELTRLIESTLASPESFRGLTGEDRGMLYLVASTTGLTPTPRGHHNPVGLRQHLILPLHLGRMPIQRSNQLAPTPHGRMTPQQDHRRSQQHPFHRHSPQKMKHRLKRGRKHESAVRTADPC